MRLSKVHLSIIALITTNVIWGAAAPIFKWSLQDIEPFTLAFLRFFIAALILLPFTLHNLKIQKRDYLYLTLMALIGFNVHIGTLLWALTLSPSINAPIIASAAPIFIILGSIAFLKEHPKRKVIIGTILSLAGVVLVIVRPLLEEGLNGGSLTGNLLLLIATFSLVVYTMMLKRIEGKYKTVPLLFWTFAIASVFFLPLTLFEVHNAGGFLVDLSMRGLIGIVYGALFVSLIAYLCFTFALKHVNASEVGIYLYMDPVIAILIAIPLLGESLTVYYVIGSALVFIGIFIAEGRIQYHPFHKFKKK